MKDIGEGVGIAKRALNLYRSGAGKGEGKDKIEWEEP